MDKSTYSAGTAKQYFESETEFKGSKYGMIVARGKKIRHYVSISYGNCLPESSDQTVTIYISENAWKMVREEARV